MILLWLECDADGVTEISLETVAFARSLSAAGGGIAIRAALFGEVPEAARNQLAAHGVDEVHHVTGPAYDAFGTFLTSKMVFRPYFFAVVVSTAKESLS